MQATKILEGYDSFEQIALGGMATVYKARKVSLDKPVAVKVLYPHLAQDAVFLKRFKREARTAAQVQHDNIVNVIDYGETDDTHYIVMEYYDGLNVEDLLAEQKVIPLDVCFMVLLNVCYGLEAAHAEELVHRDIKPANIIITKQGGVKIADFGLAKNVEQAKLVTQADKIVGTPAYMSPEQTRGDDLGPQSDIFSLGVVAFELLCGKRPFDGKTYSEVVDKIQAQEVEPVSTLNSLINDSFTRIITHMLAKNVAERYQHISEVVMDLEEAVEEHDFKLSRRALGKYIEDPGAYLKNFNAEVLKKLRAAAPDPDEVSADAQIRYYSRIIALDPSDKKAKKELERLRKSGGRPGRGRSRQKEGTAEAGSAAVDRDDPDAEYRVFLEGVDMGQETPDSFALKLSMRVRSPLPRIKSLVNNMPSQVVGHLSLRKAKKLCSIIEELGGSAYYVAHEQEAIKIPAESPRAGDGPEPVAVPDPTAVDEHAAAGKPFDQGKTEQFHPIELESKRENRPVPKPLITCPKCDWEGDADARFCPICMFKFDKTENIDLTSLSRRVIENPLLEYNQEQPLTGGLKKKWDELPLIVKYAVLGTVLVLALLVIFSR